MAHVLQCRESNQNGFLLPSSVFLALPASELGSIFERLKVQIFKRTEELRDFVEDAAQSGDRVAMRLAMRLAMRRSRRPRAESLKAVWGFHDMFRYVSLAEDYPPGLQRRFCI